MDLNMMVTLGLAWGSFILGMFVGALIGVFTAGLLAAAHSDAEEDDL